MTSMIQSLSTEFQAELKTKQDSLDVTQAHLRAATRELSEQRKQIQTWQIRCGELDQINHRVRNVQKALSQENMFDWTGRTDLEGNDALETAGPAFQHRGAASTMVGIGGTMDISFSVDSEAPLPAQDLVATLIKLRRMKMWHVRMEELINARLKSLQGASAEKEYQCKKIVALCTGLPLDKVEDVSWLLGYVWTCSQHSFRCLKTWSLRLRVSLKSSTLVVSPVLCRKSEMESYKTSSFPLNCLYFFFILHFHYLTDQNIICTLYFFWGKKLEITIISP
jgi:hypothetical protein